LRVSYDTGAEVAPPRDLDAMKFSSLIVGQSMHASVPTAGEVALVLLACVLAAAGTPALRLR
jgi:hypothetical protein